MPNVTPRTLPLEGKLSPKVTDEVGERQATKKTKPQSLCTFLHLTTLAMPTIIKPSIP